MFQQGRYTETETFARAITARFPQHAFGWKALGTALLQQGCNEKALVPLRKAAELSKGDSQLYINLGNTLAGLGRLPEAESSFRRALEIKPDIAEAHYNLGATLKAQNRFLDAEASYRRTLDIWPDFVEAHYDLSASLYEQGRFAEAEACLRRTLELKPDFPEANINLALLLNAQGKPEMALDIINQSLQIKETAAAKSIFVACVKRIRFVHATEPLRQAMARALSDPWGRPADLAGAGASIVKLNRNIGACVERAAISWPQSLAAQDLFGPAGIAAVATDPLLCALLDASPICDMELEQLLTIARHVMLDAATEAIASGSEDGITSGFNSAPGFISALARQCFINEYVFALTGDEAIKARSLRDSLAAALENEAPVSALWLVTVAAYFPLHSLPLVERLLERQWHDAVAAVLVQQVCEPEEERQYRATIPRLTTVEDDVSLLVQNQYEENPYPRWVKAEPVNNPETIDKFLRQKFPLTAFQPLGKRGKLDILVAGCGTGQQSIGTARNFLGGQILAVDLSLTSLCYAKRKTRELGLNMIEYAQADIMKLGSLGYSFDVIESTGVLHHLADPLAGWQVLLSLLRPGGFMRLGFYSEIARRNVVRAQIHIAEQGYGSTNEDIRRCRQDLMNSGKNSGFETMFKTSDFFSISACRDLLFHVQEHRMTLTGIDAFLHENHLKFLGFEIDAPVLNLYKRRFPDDCTATNLRQWQIFENENPDTFLGMYQFWVQKTG